MLKYRLISKWTSDYFPKSYRQDGKPQERVEVVGLPSEEEAIQEFNYFNKHLSGAWVAERYEIDDGKYMCFELIMPEIVSTIEVSEEKPEFVSVVEEKKEEPVEAIKQPELLKIEEIFGPTKTIYVAKYIATQRNLDPSIQKINGRVSPEERAKIYSDFNNNLIAGISVTEAVARMGGIRYDENGKEINIEFLDDIDIHTQECILSKINKKF